jgi:hypothetical protein
MYTPEGDISLINNYVDGKLEGVALHMAYRNQVDQRAIISNGVLHGPWLGYKFGKNRRRTELQKRPSWMVL